MKKTILAAAVLILIWWLFSFFADTAILPSPEIAVQHLFTQRSDGLLMHIGISLFRVCSALILAFIPAFIFGILAGVNKAADSIASPFVYILFPVPKVAFLPIILIIFGLGNWAKIFIVSFIVFFQFYLHIRDETKGLNRKYFDSLISLGGKRMHMLVHVILPALLPRILSSLRLTLGTGIAVLFFTETFATKTGIGWYIMDAWARLDYLDMYSGIIVLGLTGLLMFGLIDLVYSRFCKWKRL